VDEPRGDNLLVRSIRGRPREVLEVVFTRIYVLLVLDRLTDNAEFIEYLDESELRDYLAQNPDEIEPGLHVIRTERQIGEGYADIVARDREGRYVVIEVKRVTAGKEAVQQLHRYVEKLRAENPEAPVRGILVAPSISRDARKLLEKLGLEYRQINIAKIYQKALEKGKLHRVDKTRSLLDYFSGRA
jgi:RecB family endonuclease NucS